MDFITPDDKKRMLERLAVLKAKRPIIIKRIAEARELGDLSENAEYHAAREDQGLDEAKILTLEKRLASAKVADCSTLPEDMVFVGATVRLRDVTGDDDELYKLVGEVSGDFDPECIEVSASSPMGIALMRSRIGETVRVDLPRGEKRFEILEIIR